MTITGRIKPFLNSLFKRQLYISHHIPKTAGTSFLEVLKTLFDNNLFLDYNTKNRNPLKVDKIPKSAKCIHGHFLQSKYMSYYPEAKWITWLRDPVERIISTYHQYFRLPNPKHPFCMEVVETNMPLEEFVQKPLMANKYFQLSQVKLFESYDFVGITEDFERACQLFLRMFDFPEIKGLNLDKENINPDKKNQKYEIESSLKNIILKHHNLDIGIYERMKDNYYIQLENFNLL